LAAQDDRVVVVKLARNYGQSTATQAGFDRCRGKIVATLDGDLQNDPEDIPRLVAALEQGYDLVAGRRERRKEPLLTRRFPSMVANWLIRKITGVPIHDSGCSLRAYRRELLDRVRLYSDLHRFTPAVAGALGARIAELPVRDHPRRHGVSKYGLSRLYVVAIDLLVLRTIRVLQLHPYTLFGSSAATAFGLAIVAGIAAVRFRASAPEYAYSLVLPGVAFALLGLASYLLMLGLIVGVAVPFSRDEAYPLEGRMPEDGA
jgi:glycosyltransferase involved in cell wall biosynthesis